MRRNRPRHVIAVLSALAAFTTPVAGATDAPARAQRAQAVDLARRIDVNRINMCVANTGQIGYDIAHGGAGLIYPRGSVLTTLFDAGPWLGGLVGGEPRVAVAYYESEFGPGAMVDGVQDDPARPEYHVYKVVRWNGLASDSAHVERRADELAADPFLDTLAHHSWSEYMAGAAPYGAPWRLYRLPNSSTSDPTDSVDVPGPDVLGDEMLWCVFNDADPALHISEIGRSRPLGVEVRQSVFAFDRPGPLGNAVFIRYELHNRGSNTIEDMRAAVWSDPDVGGPYDDLIGCMESRSLGYAYNGTNADFYYGAAVPAIGFDLLSAHSSTALGRETGMDAFMRMRKAGEEPSNSTQVFNVLRGLQRIGSPTIDPASGAPTAFMVSGDPVAGTGWLDNRAGDKRMLSASGPWTLGPGDSLTLWVAIVIGQADTPTGAVTALGCADDYVQDVFDAGFAEPFRAPPVCFLPPADCPRSAAWWAEHCASGSAFTSDEWRAIAHTADSISVVFSFLDRTSSSEYCHVLTGPRATARDSARSEYLALLSNVAAGMLGLVPSDGSPVRLGLGTEIAAPPLEPSSAGVMIRDTPDSLRSLLYAAYSIVDYHHNQALDQVDIGLGGFGGGGAGAAVSFLGSSIDPKQEPDSFTTVQLRFSRAATQRAYRFLRLERARDGGVPPQGRAYLYGGYRDVPLQAWDTAHDRELELAFVERTLTSDDGTILPEWAQPATRDSTWGPDDSASGGDEYLFVLDRAYSGAPVEPGIGHNGAVADGSIPLMWVLVARLRAADAVINDGDRFSFEFDYPPTRSAERLFQWLEPLSPTDTSAVSRYRLLAVSLSDVNDGLGIGPVCGSTVPSPATLIEASASWAQGVTLRWLLGVRTSAARLEYRNEYGVWLDQAPVTIDGQQAIAQTYIPSETFPYGGRVAYRLALAAPIGLIRTDSVWVALPQVDPQLAFAGVWPNPSADGRPRVAFTLPVAGNVRLDVVDVAGRVVAGREIAGMDAGTHLLEIAPDHELRPGIYFVRLRFGAEHRTARLVMLR